MATGRTCLQAIPMAHVAPNPCSQWDPRARYTVARVEIDDVGKEE